MLFQYFIKMVYMYREAVGIIFSCTQVKLLVGRLYRELTFQEFDEQ